MDHGAYPPPEPPPEHRLDQRRLVRRGFLIIAGAIVTALLVIAAFVVPIPLYYTYLPGPVRDVERLVKVPNQNTYSSEGQLYLTTVSVDPKVTTVELFQAAFDPQVAVVQEEQVTGGQSLEQLERQQRIEMTQSKRRAEEVALSALGFGKPTGRGARVVATFPDTPARGVLKPGDVIVAINGEKVKTTCDVGRAVDQTEIGDDVSLEIVREDDTQSVDVRTTTSPLDPRNSFIGIQMTDIDYRFKTGVEVEFKTGRIAGPSAGLMFTLALYDRLTPEDLTKGRAIAGTGTIDCGGGVGPIGGVEQKVAGAEARGAEIFLSPTANAEDARRVAQGIDVVAVSTFDDALRYLEGLPQ